MRCTTGVNSVLYLHSVQIDSRSIIFSISAAQEDAVTFQIESWPSLPDKSWEELSDSSVVRGYRRVVYRTAAALRASKAW